MGDNASLKGSTCSTGAAAGLKQLSTAALRGPQGTREQNPDGRTLHPNPLSVRGWGTASLHATRLRVGASASHAPNLGPSFNPDPAPNPQAFFDTILVLAIVLGSGAMLLGVNVVLSNGSEWWYHRG